jgi:hypothetical protein
LQRWISLGDEVLSGKVGELPEGGEIQLVVPGDMHMDCFVKVEDFVVVSGKLHGCELPDDEFFVLGELISAVGINIWNGLLGNSKGDGPLPVGLYCSGWFAGFTARRQSDVDVSDGFCV